MANAITAVFGGDSRPMEAEFAKSEIMAKRFGKTLADVNAADNERMLRNSAALKALNAERVAARAELERYNETLRTQGKTTASASRTAANAGEDEAFLRQNAQIKIRIAEIAAQKAASIENDIEAKASYERLQIFKKEAEERAAIQKAEQLSAIESRITSTGGGGGMFSSHGGGFSGIIRELTVIIREIAMGRGIGRILGSVSLLAQYMGLLGKLVRSTAQEQIQAAHAAAQLSKEMDLAALATEEKAAASLLATKAEGADIAATEALAMADMESAEAARIAAVAQAEKAAAADLAMRRAMAAATVTIGPVGWAVLGVVAALALLYGAYKIVHHIIESKNEADRVSIEMADRYTLSIKEEIDAMDRLHDAMDKTLQTLHDLNRAQDDFVEKTRAVIEAMDAEAQAQADLADAKKEGKLLDIDIQERKGQITHEDAIIAKARIEADALADAAEAKLNDLQDKATVLGQKASNAQTFNEEAQNNAYQASRALNNSPEGIQNAKDLAELEKDKNAAAQAAEDDRKKALEAGTSKKDRDELLTNAAKNDEAAQTFSDLINIQKTKMSPAEVAAADAMEKARQAAAAAKTTKDQATAAQNDVTNFQNNYQTALGQQQENIFKKANLDILGLDQKSERRSAGFSLNEQQRLGAYAATPPEMLKHTRLLEKIEANTQGFKPHPQAPPGQRPPQHGGRPPH